MAFTNSTTHYGLPQWIGTDKPTYLVDQNNAYATIDTQLYNASTDASSAVATANSAATSATTAAENAATALSTANTADGKADSAITQAGLAQTAAGAAQVAAAAAQEAAAGNSITNLAPAYDSTLTYNVGDLVTADGKLYKCIVAVATPMDFDINYWDDVTTSEVYARLDTINNKLQTVNMDVNSSFTYDSDNDLSVLFMIKDLKYRMINYDAADNLLVLTKSNDGNATHEDAYLYATLVKGQSINIMIDTFATINSSDTALIPINSPVFLDDLTSNYTVTITECELGHKVGTAGTYQLTTPAITLVSMRKECALVSVQSADITTEAYDVNSVVRAYINVTITRNS